MTAIDYVALARMCKASVEEAGREITLHKLSASVANPLKPWRGAGTPTKVASVATVGAFVVPNTSIPTESRGLGLDWVDQDLLKRARRVCIVAAYELPNLDDYNIVTDGSDDLAILWVQCLQPGPIRLLYVFGFGQ
jgi:hypothetical protein